MKRSSLVIFAFLVLFTSCNNDDDAPQTTDVQNFMWRAMNLWYFWQQDVPDLADNRFTTNEEYLAFLEATPNPEAFIESLLFTEDRFTFWDEDYTTLVNNLNGISKSNGLELGLGRIDGGTNLFGFVKYIIPNSDAASKDIERGYLFTKVNGQQLTESNYIELLFGSIDTYTINNVIFDNGALTETNRTVSLTKEEGLVENPILIARTFEVNGTKIAYLMYNGFTRDFDNALNNTFGQFIADGATELVIDFRYNGGGSVNTSRLLSSMIYGRNTNQVYIKQRWNDKLQNEFSPAQLQDYFAAEVNGANLNSLNLTRVFVITTGRTASASELVINGLDPYMEVIKIGETTRGKNEFSITLVDNESNSFVYDAGKVNQIKSGNRWAIQPLVGRNENSVGFSDYTDGFAPDYELEEDIANMGVLGDLNEPLLARAIELITSESSKSLSVSPAMPSKAFGVEEISLPKRDLMILDKPLNLSRN